MSEDIGSMGLRRNGGAVVALRSGFALVNFPGGEVQKLCDLIPRGSDLRFNDGRCDRHGRFWSGTLHEKRQVGTGALYRLGTDLGCHKLLEGITVSNGIAWSPDDLTMYFADSHVRTIFSFDFDIQSGTLGNRRIFAELAPDDGVPDGATVDLEGFLWSANFDGGCITRYAPDGRVDRVVPFPVKRPTSCAFGGDGLNILYVTSASRGLPEEHSRKGSLAGGLFALDVGVKGLPEPRFAG
jgi:sugar lactone lactonase YvrE